MSLRALAGVCLALSLSALAGLAGAADTRHESGGFHYYRSPVPDWVEVATVASSWPADAPGASDTSWRNWLLDAQVDRRTERRRRYFDTAFEATTEAMLAYAGRFTIDFSPDYQTLHLHRIELRRDGHWQDRMADARITLAQREGDFESDMSTGTVSALMVIADVRPGDVVRYAYSVEGENPVMGGHTHDAFSLAWTDPILLRRVRVDFAPGIEPSYRLINSDQAPALLELEDGQRLQWVGENLAAVAQEDNTPPWYSTVPMIEVAPRKAWRDVVAWATDLYPRQQPLPAELEARLAQWQTLPSPEQRVAAALQAVQDEVRYFSVLLGDSTHRPAEPMTSWDRRFGDCKDKALLLVHLLERMGVQANPALVSSQRERAIGEGLPAASQFDHVIVEAEVNGRRYWLDPTLTHQRGPLAMRQASDFGLALPISASTAALRDMSELRELRSERSVHERYVVQEDGRSVRFEITTELRGGAANQRRREIAASSVDRLSRDFADYYRRLHGELEVAEPLRIEDDEAAGVLRMHETYTLQKPWNHESPSQRTIDFYADMIAPLLRLEGALERAHPLWRPHPLTLEQTVELVLPKDWSSGEAPGDVEISDHAFAYRREISRIDGGLRIVQTYRSEGDHVPVEAQAKHFDQRRTAVDALSVRMNLNPPRESSARERSRRLRALIEQPTQ
jgi:hypothetical protein